MTIDNKLLIDLLMGKPSNNLNPYSRALPVEPLPPPGSVFGSPNPWGNALSGIVSPPAPEKENFNALLRALGTPAPVLPVARSPAPAVRPEPPKRMVYFAFDFDDLMRVNNVRQTGKIGGRVIGGARGFRDRSVWEASKATADRGLKEMMQRMSKFSSVVCVLIGSNTWISRWVRYEVALAIIEERGLLAVDLNGINHNIRRAPDPLGLNPLAMMGLRKDHDGSWHLVERKPVELDNGNVGFEWHWYNDYQRPVPRPRYVPDMPAGKIVALSEFTKRYDFSGHSGSMNISSWLDVAAVEVGR
jgi:MTH538 TIR-like domain (DUF1863)